MSKTTTRVAKFFKVRPGEGGAVTLMWVHSFFIGLAIVFLETPSSSLFLTYFEVAALPYFFMATAAASVVVGFFVTWIQRHCSPARFFLGLLGSIFLISLAFYIGLRTGLSRPLVLALMIWKDVVWTLIIIEFWAVAGLVLHVRQGKRLFGLLNSGKILAGLLGGLSTPLLVKQIGTLHLVALALVGLFGAFVSLALIVRAPKVWPTDFEDEEETDDEGGGERLGVKFLFRNRFLIFFFVVTVISNLVYYFIEYIFYDQVAQAYPDQDQIASFFGLYIGVGQGFNLIVSALFTGRLLTRFGLSAGLLSVPMLVIAGLSAALFARWVPGSGGAQLFFWCLIGSKLTQEVVGSAMESPASRILYQPLGQRVRIRVQTVLESIVQPLAIGFAGLFLLLLPLVVSIGTLGWLYIVLALLVIWLLAALRLRTEYTQALSQALQGRRIRHFDLTLDDASSLQVLERELDNPRPGGIIYCLNTLRELGHPALDRFLLRLIDHPSEMVREYVVGQVEKRHLTDATDLIAHRIDVESAPRVRGAALRAFCALSQEGGFDKVLRFLEADEPDVREGAVIGLLRSGGIEGVLAAGTRLIHLIEAADPRERIFAAHALGEVGISSFYRPLVQLLEDPEMRVRREALKAAGKLKSPGLVQPVMGNLGVPAVADAAVSCLIAFGEGPLAQLEERFRQPGVPTSVRSRIARIAGHVGGDGARAFLKAWLDHPREELRFYILQALVQCRYRALDDEVDKVRQTILFEAADAAWTLATLIDLGDEKLKTEVGAALHREIGKNTDRILLLLSFLFPAEDVLQAKARLESEVAAERARALEVLDNLIDGDLKTAILPLIDDLGPRTRLERMARRFPQQICSREERLRQLMTRTSDKSTSWAKACAIHAVGRSRLAELEEAVVAALDDGDPFIRETAVWALAQLRPESLTRHLPKILDDPVRSVAYMARWLMAARSPVKVFGGVGYLARTAGYRVDFLERLLTDEQQPLETRTRAARILGALHDPMGKQALLRRLSLPEAPLRGVILASLSPGSEGFGRRATTLLSQCLDHEVSLAESLSHRLIEFPSGELFQNLQEALSAELASSRERILRTMVFLSGSSDLPVLDYWYLRVADAEVPDAAGDALRSVLRCVENLERRERLRTFLETGSALPPKPAGDAVAAEEKPPLAIALSDIARDSSVRAWTRSCALNLLARLGLPECAPAIVEALSDAEEMVREIAYWALWKLNRDVFQRECGKRGEDPSPRVARLVHDLVKSET